MQPLNQNTQVTVDAKLRVMRTLWLALVVSVALYFVMALLVPTAINPIPMLSLGLLLAGMMFVVASILIKWKQLDQAIEQQNTAQVQVAYVLALALCEVPALFGILDHFVTGNRYYYVLMLIAGGGQLYHFPKRQHVLDASFRTRSTTSSSRSAEPVASHNQTGPPLPPEF